MDESDMLTVPAAFTPLTFYPQWVLYKLVPRADGGTDKLPVNHRTGQLPGAGMGGSNIWTDSDTALAAAARYGAGYGSGFSFADSDPFWFIDLDKALQPDNTWAQWALDVVNMLPGASIEVSQSGRGLHIIGSGTIPNHACKCLANNHLEMYHTGRFVALTGYSANGDAFTDLTNELAAVVTRWFAPVATINAHTFHPDREADDDTIADLKDALTCLCADDYREWTSVGIALASIGEAGYDLWTAWSATSEKHDESLCEYKWTTFQPEHTGFASVFTKAQRMGWVNPKARKPIDLTGVFPASVPPQAAPALGVAPAIAAEPRAITGSTLAFDADQVKIFAGCTYVLDKREILLPNGTLVGKDQFDDWYGKYAFVKNTENSCAPEKSAWTAFVRSQLRDYPRAESSCFNPAYALGEILSVSGRSMVNTFRPISTVSVDGDVSPILVHLNKLLPVKRDYDIFLSYLAAIVQYPGHKTAWCPVVQGTKGNGKSLIGELMEAVVGYEYSHRPSGQDINNKFTGWLDRKLLVVLEELGVYEKRETLETLKVMITGKRIEIQKKGQDQVTGENRANFLVFVNEKDAIPVDDQERRYANLFTAQQSHEDIIRDGMDAAYFNRLFEWLETDGASHFHYYLAHYAIQDEFNPTVGARRAPVTSSTHEAIAASRGTVASEILEMIESKATGFAGGWICSLDLDNMLKMNRMDKAMPRTKRRELLRSLGYDWHPALQLGRTNNPLPGYSSKPVLFIKKDHPHRELRTGAEVIKAFQAAQGGGAAGLVGVFNNEGVGR